MEKRVYSVNINNLVEVPGRLYLIGAFDSLEGNDKKSFEIKIQTKKPKKISRKCTFYVEKDYDISSITLMYMGEKECVYWNKNIPVLEKDDAYVFDLLNFLNKENIPYTIPDYRRISFNTKLWMIYDSGGYYPYPYGTCVHLRETGLALDGTGSGYIYYFYKDYLNFDHIGINKICIHSRNLKPIQEEMELFLENHKAGEASKEEWNHLLSVICQGNEIGIETDTIKVLICRHYQNEIKVTIDGKKLIFDNYKGDILHSLVIKEEDIPVLKEAEAWYVRLLNKLIYCKTEDEVKQCFKE